MDKMMKIPVMNDNLRFDEAFASARKLGVSEFVWRNKRYHTRLFSDKVEVERREIEKAKRLKPIGWVDA